MYKESRRTWIGVVLVKNVAREGEEEGQMISTFDSMYQCTAH